jgi:hypothetical protein
LVLHPTIRGHEHFEFVGRGACNQHTVPQTFPPHELDGVHVVPRQAMTEPSVDGFVEQHLHAADAAAAGSVSL